MKYIICIMKKIWIISETRKKPFLNHSKMLTHSDTESLLLQNLAHICSYHIAFGKEQLLNIRWFPLYQAKEQNWPQEAPIS